MQPKISVITPVYNSAPYLHTCVESILAQTYQNMEIIFVNDGSTDESLAILSAYAKADPRIIVIDKPHGGVCAARNAALDSATGAYIGFIDSDDIADPALYQRLMETLTAYHADIAVCGFYFHYADHHLVRSSQHNQPIVYPKGEAIQNAVIGKPYAGHLWDKLFKASLFLSERFHPQLTVFEDLELFLRLLRKADTLVYDPEPLYQYVQRETSAFSRADASCLDSVRLACDTMIRLHGSQYPELVRYVHTLHIQYILLVLEHSVNQPATSERKKLRSAACADIRSHWDKGMRKRVQGYDGWLALAALPGFPAYRIGLLIFRSLQKLRKAFHQ